MITIRCGEKERGKHISCSIGHCGHLAKDPSVNLIGHIHVRTQHQHLHHGFDEGDRSEAKVLGGHVIYGDKVGCIHIRLDHVIIAKIHLSPAATTGRRLLQIPSARTFRDSS